MSMFFRPYDLYEDITLDDMRLPFHPPRYPTDEESNPSKLSYSTYSMESYRSEPSHPFVIRLSSDSSASTVGPAPPSVRGYGFIWTHVVPRGHGRAQGGGRGDNALDGFKNGYLPFDGWLG